MTKTNELEDLFATLERIRKEKYPKLSQGLVAQIIILEDRFFDERTLVQKHIEKLTDTEISQGYEA